MRPIDISNNDATNGLRLTFENISGSTLRHEIITGAGGGGATLTGTYPSGFAANQVYHVGVTYSTDAITGVTAAKMFAVSGTGAIITSGSNAATPITTATFTLNPGVVTNTTGFLSNGTWAFGDWSANGTIRSNDYGSLRLYSQDPGVFPAFPVNVSNANLSNLALSAGTLSPAFVSGTTSYTASVINSVNSITVTPTAAQANATVTVNGVSVISGVASSSISLNVGTNTITAVVTAQDGVTIQTYTVTLTRAPSSNANLSGLALSAGTLFPAFSSGTAGYTASVGNATSSITVTPTASDAAAAVKVNGGSVTSGSASGAISLVVGANTLSTVVTAQNGVTTQTYTVTVTRLNNLNTWRETYFPGSTATTGPGADSATPLNDGIENLLKFALGMDPTKHGTMPGTLTTGGGNLTFTYTPSAAAVTDGVTFTVESSDTLAAGSWTSGIVNQGTIGPGGAPVTATAPKNPAGRRFLRLKITPP